MSNIEAVGGVHSFLLYAEEATYNTDPGSGYAHFGLVKSFKPAVSNETIKLRGFAGSTSGGRAISQFAAGKHTASGTIDFDVNDWQFLKFVMGSEAGSYTYTASNIPPSISIHHCISNPGTSSTAQDLVFTGSVIDSVSIKCAVGEPVSCSINFMSALAKYDTTVLSNTAMFTDSVFNFSGASIELPDGTPLNNIIDSVEISIKNNWEILYGLGSRLGQRAFPKELDYNIKFTLKYIDNENWNKLLGAATPSSTAGATENATIAVKFMQGTQSADFVFSNFVFDEETMNVDLNQVISEDLSGTAKTLVITDDRT